MFAPPPQSEIFPAEMSSGSLQGFLDLPRSVSRSFDLTPAMLGGAEEHAGEEGLHVEPGAAR